MARRKPASRPAMAGAAPLVVMNPIRRWPCVTRCRTAVSEIPTSCGTIDDTASPSELLASSRTTGVRPTDAGSTTDWWCIRA
jgi:hypothetical protein